MDAGLLRHPLVGSSVASASPAPPAARILADMLAAAALARRRSDPSIRGRMTPARTRPRLGSATVTQRPSSRVAPAVTALAPAFSSSSAAGSAPPSPAAGQAPMPPQRCCPSEHSSVELVPPSPLPGLASSTELASSSTLPSIQVAASSHFEDDNNLTKCSCRAASSVVAGRGANPGRSPFAEVLSHGGLGSDPAVVVEGLGSLSLPQASSGEAAMVSAEASSVEDGDEVFPAAVGAKACSMDTGCVEQAEAPWVLVQPRRSVRRMAFAPPTSKTRPPPPTWLNGRCHRCHEAGHWASTCCEPLRCNNCRQFGHKAKCCRGKTAPRPPPVHVRHVAHAPAADRPPPRQRSPPRPQVRPEPPCQPSGVLLQSVLVNQLVDQLLPLRGRPAPPPSTMDAQLTLAEEAMLLRSELQGCLARMASFLVRADAALGTSPIETEASSQTELDAGSAGIGKEVFYGSFSPRAMPCPMMQTQVSAPPESETLAPVLLLMPELHELCGELAPPLSMVQLEVDSLGPSPVASLPPSQESSQPVLADSEALFGKELCGLLASLETVSPGSGKEIAHLLSGKDTGNKVKKVQEYLKSNIKKSGTTMKASATT